MTDEQIEQLRGAALWALMHHQGGSSPVGQPLRKALGIAPYDDLTQEQYAAAKVAAGEWGPLGRPSVAAPRHGADASGSWELQRRIRAVPLPVRYEPHGGCTCAGPDGPCAACISNEEAYNEWLTDPSISPREAAAYGLECVRAALARGIGAEGQDAQRLGAEPAEPAPQDAPKTCKNRSEDAPPSEP